MDDARLPEPETRDPPHQDPSAGTRPDADTQEADKPETDQPPGRGRGRVLLIIAAVFLLIGAGGVWYWLQSRGTESTDDAFIDGNVSQVAPQIAGRVTTILIRDNQMVTAGQELLRIDPRDQQVKLDQAVAQRAQAAAQLDQARAMLGVRHTDLGQADAQVRVTDADLVQARQDLARYRAINPRAITRQTLDSATANARASQARLEANRQAARGMHAQLSVAEAQVKAAEAAVQTADANVAAAQLDLSYTHVLAPAPGRITRRTVQLGSYVTPGSPLLAIVQPDLWVTANFKETQLAAMRPGQHVRVRVDAFPDKPLDAHVDSLQSGTGSVFAALPAENATGNYVKVVQRLPVKILFDGDAARQLPLAPGMSVLPRVELH